MERYVITGAGIKRVDKQSLYHTGKKGMKWGVRRYQNEDGTLTELGRKRYARDAREREYSEYDESSSKYYKRSKKQGRQDLEVDAHRYVKEDRERTKKLAEAGSKLTNDLKQINDRAIKNLPKNTMDLSSMTDKEMREQINRALLERQYNDLLAPKNESKGRERVSKILEGVGSTLAVTSSALGIALAVKELMG